MFWKNCGSMVWEARKKGRRNNTRPVTDFGEPVGHEAKYSLPQLPNTPFMVLIRLMSNSNNEETSSMQPQALYPEVKNWEEMIDIIENKCHPKKPYCPTALYQCNL